MQEPTRREPLDRPRNAPLRRGATMIIVLVWVLLVLVLLWLLLRWYGGGGGGGGWWEPPEPEPDGPPGVELDERERVGSP